MFSHFFKDFFFKGPMNHGVPKVYRRRVKPFYKGKPDLKPYSYMLTRGKPVKTIEQQECKTVLDEPKRLKRSKQQMTESTSGHRCQGPCTTDPVTSTSCADHNQYLYPKPRTTIDIARDTHFVTLLPSSIAPSV